MTDAVVCGAGAAGLAAAAMLRKSGVQATIFERTDAVATSWRTRYDGLRLNTPAWMSTMPGYRATARKFGAFPSRDGWVRYLEEYAAFHRLDIRFGVDVERFDRDGRRWRVEAGADSVTSDVVVVATGHDREPDLPDWPGRESFTGTLIHSSAYRSPQPFAGRDVLVVGPNTTGSEVAYFLATGGARRVRVACRTPPNFTARRFLGVSPNVPGLALNHVPLRVADEIAWLAQRIMFGRLDRHGLVRSPEGIATTLLLRHQAPAYDDGFIAELKAGRIEIVPAVVGFEGDLVRLADGTAVRPDAVIAATGYRRGLAQLVGHLGVLDEDGMPLVSGGRDHPNAPNMFFNGYRADLSGQLRLMRIDARAIARTVRQLPD